MQTRSLTILILIFLLPTLASAQQERHHIKLSKEKEAWGAEKYLVSEFRLTLSAALALTAAARTTATAMDKAVSIAILDQSGIEILISRGDGVGPHNTEAARRKAYTALSTKTETRTLARKVKHSSDSENLAHMPELLLLGGGVPLIYNAKVVGSIGVAGGGGAENDELIAKSAALHFLNITKSNTRK